MDANPPAREVDTRAKQADWCARVLERADAANYLGDLTPHTVVVPALDGLERVDASAGRQYALAVPGWPFLFAGASRQRQSPV